MATQAFTDWVKQGRPFRLALPVIAYRDALRAAGWPGASVGTIGDYDHLTAEVPQDHTPFSVTGWPDPNPYPFVLALDAGHLPDQGHDMGPVASAWLADAKAGRTPWVKYINWRGQQYDVRRDWAARPISGHYDHAHVSFRTDWYDKGIGSYVVVQKGIPVTTSQTGRDVWAETINSPDLGYSDSAGEWLKWTLSTDRKVDQLLTKVDGLAVTLATLLDRLSVPLDVEKLATLLGSNPAFADALAASLAAAIGKPVSANGLAAALVEAARLLRGE